MTPIKCIAEGREDSRRQGSGYLLNGEVHSHEIVGIIDVLGAGVDGERLGCGVGVPWLGYACGACAYCRTGSENLCERPLFTGYTRDGGFATSWLPMPALPSISATRPIPSRLCRCCARALSAGAC